MCIWLKQQERERGKKKTPPRRGSRMQQQQVRAEPGAESVGEYNDGMKERPGLGDVSRCTHKKKKNPHLRQ